MDERTALLPPISTRTLNEMLAQGPLPLPKGVELLGVIAGSIAKLHAAGRTHGLLSPEAIRVQHFESGAPLVLLLDVEVTRDMSPGADQFQLGVLAFEVLAGRRPQPGEALRQAVPDAPAALEKLVGRLMAPRPADRLAAAGAERQLLDLAEALSKPHATAVEPLEALPTLKKPTPNPYEDDEATATVRSPTEPTLAQTPPKARRPTVPTRGRAGPAMEDEPTQFAPVKWNKYSSEPERTPLPPPVATPGPSVVVRRSGDEETGAFEPSRSDLPGRAPDLLQDPRLAPRRRQQRNPAEHSPMSELIHVAKQQPPWMWAAIGVGLAFFVLLLIALAR